MVFVLAVEQWTSSSPSAGSWRLHGSSPNRSVYMFFVDLEKMFNCVPWGVLWGVLREYGVPDPLTRSTVVLYDWCQRLVRIVSSKSDVFLVRVGLHQGCPLSPILFIIFMDRISSCSQGVEGSGLATSESGLWFLWMMWFC